MILHHFRILKKNVLGELGLCHILFHQSPLLLLISHFEYPRPPIQFYTVDFIYFIISALALGSITILFLSLYSTMNYKSSTPECAKLFQMYFLDDLVLVSSHLNLELVMN